MLGLYERFPENVHKIVGYAASVPFKRLQEALVRVFAKLNGESLKLEDVTGPSIPDCNVIPEFGIAEGNSFNYLDDTEATKIVKSLHKNPFEIMDLLCALRYQKTQQKNKTPLRFDYYMIRLAFSKDQMEMRVFHERGPRHVSPDDIVNLLTKGINEVSPRRMIRPMWES